MSAYRTTIDRGSIDVGKARCRIIVFVRVEVSGQPECLVVAGHGELRPLLGNAEVGCPVPRVIEEVAERHALIVEAELYGHRAARGGLTEGNAVETTVVANSVILSEDGRPEFVDCAGLHRINDKAAVKAAAIGQQEAHTAGAYHGRTPVPHLIVRHAVYQ